MFGDLSFARLRVSFRVLRDCRLPPFAGSALRGAWGHALRRVRHHPRRRRCQICSLWFHCQNSRVDRYLFESPVDHPFFPALCDSFTYKLARFPPPFVLEPPPGGHYRAGDIMESTWVLVGKAIACARFAVCSWMHMENGRLGQVPGAVRLEKVVSVDPLDGKGSGEVLFPESSDGLAPCLQLASWPLIQRQAAAWTGGSELRRVRLQFTTPVRLKDENRLGSVPDFSVLMRSILRRMTLLSVHSPLSDAVDHKRLLEASRAVITAASNLHWQDWERYSCRQRQSMSLGGYVGDIVFQGPLAGFVPYLLLGSQLHMGKQASFGLGHYRMEPYFKEPAEA